MTKANEVKILLETASAAAAEVRDRVFRLRKTIVELTQQVRHEQRAPVPVPEIDGRVPEVVAALGARWLAENGDGLISSAGAIPGVGSPRYHGSVQLPDGMANDFFGALCCGDPESAADLLRRLVRAVSFTPGTESTARQAAIESLKAQLEARQIEEERAVDEAQAAGLNIEHRPDVVNRRQQEARKRELEEQDVAERQQRQAVVDAEHEQKAAKPPPLTGKEIMPPSTVKVVKLDENGNPPQARGVASPYLAAERLDRSGR